MSRYLRLNLTDLIKGAILAVSVAILTMLYPIIQAGRLPNLAELQACGLAALATLISYLLKNLLTNSAGKAGPEKTATPIP